MEKEIRGTVYKISCFNDGEQRILTSIFEPYEKDVTFEEFCQKQERSYWLQQDPMSMLDPSVTFYYIFYSLDGSRITQPVHIPDDPRRIFGLFIPEGVSKKVVIERLRNTHGPTTQLRYRKKPIIAKKSWSNNQHR